MKPYTYKLFFKPTSQWYYGVRYAKNCDPSDLFVKYFTSSKVVKTLLQEYGKDAFIVKICRTFETIEEAFSWETRFLTRVRAAENPYFLNKSNNRGKDIKQVPCTKERKESISKSRKTTKKIKCEHCVKETDPGNFKRFHGEKCKHNPSVDKKYWESFSEICKKAQQKQVSQGNYVKPKPKVGQFVCPTCGTSGKNWGNMHAHHFENCGKKKEQSYFRDCLINCLVCKKEVNGANFKQYHGDNCKLLSKFVDTQHQILSQFYQESV